MEYNLVNNSLNSTPDSPTGSSSSDSERRSPTSVTASTLVSMSANGHAAHNCAEDKEETLARSNGLAAVRMKRQQIAQACDQCKKLHAKCTNERPCKRCEVNGTADSCSDTPRKYRGRNGKLRTLSLPNSKPAQLKNTDIVPNVAKQQEEPQKLLKPEEILPQKSETIIIPKISPAASIPEVPKTMTVVPLPALLPEINALTCPDPLNDDTIFFNTALRPNPRERIFPSGEDFDVMHFAFEDDICVDDTSSSFQWQSLLSPSFTSPQRESTWDISL